MPINKLFSTCARVKVGSDSRCARSVGVNGAGAATERVWLCVGKRVWIERSDDGRQGWTKAECGVSRGDRR